MSGETVGQALDRVPAGVSGPRSITVETGPSFNRERSKSEPIVGACNSTSFDRVNPRKGLH